MGPYRPEHPRKPSSGATASGRIPLRKERIFPGRYRIRDGTHGSEIRNRPEKGGKEREISSLFRPRFSFRPAKNRRPDETFRDEKSSFLLSDPRKKGKSGTTESRRRHIPLAVSGNPPAPNGFESSVFIPKNIRNKKARKRLDRFPARTPPGRSVISSEISSRKRNRPCGVFSACRRRSAGRTGIRGPYKYRTGAKTRRCIFHGRNADS